EIVGAAEAEEARNAGRVGVFLREQRRADEVGRAASCGIAVGYAHIGRAGAQCVGQAARAGLARLAGVGAAGLETEFVISLDVHRAGVGGRRQRGKTTPPHRIAAVTVLRAGGDWQAHAVVGDEVDADAVHALWALPRLARLALLQRRALRAHARGVVGGAG